MKSVASQDGVFVLRCLDERLILVVRQKWVWEVAEKVLEQSCDTVDIVAERGGLVELHET